jgi:SAM-dependent methyltransferase
MYIRESSMPSQEAWETLFDVESILDRFAFSGQIAELGCGYGTFSLALARRTSGTVYAIDIDPAMVATVRQRAALLGITNIDARIRDVSTDGFGLPPSSCDACLLFNILHAESPIELIREATKILKPNGVLGVIHWRSDFDTPRGPPLAIRPTADAIIDWVSEAGDLSLSDGPFALPPWHYGLKFSRTIPTSRLIANQQL